MSLLHRRMMMESNMGNFVRYEELKPTIIENAYIDNKTGTEINYYNWSATDYIPIKNSDNILTTSVLSSNEYNAFYDENKQFISSFSVGLKKYRAIILVIPQNAKYMRLSCETSYLKEIRIFKFLP